MAVALDGTVTPVNYYGNDLSQLAVAPVNLVSKASPVPMDKSVKHAAHSVLP